MKSSIYFVVGLVLMIFVLTDLAEAQKEILTIGKAQSPVLSQLKRGRAAKDARALVKEAKEKVKGQGKDEKEQRQKEKDELKNRLKNADAVVADLSEITPTEDDKLLADAAQEADVPIVLEKVAGQKMADLLGIGVDADVAALESAKGKGRLHIWGGAEEIEDEPVKEEEVELKLTPEQKAELEKRQAAGEKPQEHPPVKVEKSAKAKETKGKEQAPADIENILKNKPFSRGAASQAITGCWGKTWCKEWESYWYPYYWNPGGVPKGCLANQLEVGIYAVAGSKYIIMQQTGGIWGQMNWNSKSNRGYFIEKFFVQFTPTSLPPSWVLNKSKPDNANNQTQITTSAGVELTASYPPSMGVNASRSETRTLSDWKVVNQSWPPKAEWEFSRSSELVNFWTGFLNDVPAISKNGWQAGGTFAEAMWKGPSNSTGTASIKLYSKMTMRRSWVSWYFFVSKVSSSYSSVYRSTTWYFNTSSVYF